MKNAVKRVGLLSLALFGLTVGNANQSFALGDPPPKFQLKSGEYESSVCGHTALRVVDGGSVLMDGKAYKKGGISLGWKREFAYVNESQYPAGVQIRFFIVPTSGESFDTYTRYRGPGDWHTRDPISTCSYVYKN